MAAPNRKSFVESALAKLGSHTKVVPASSGDIIRKQFLPYIWEEFPDKQDWALMVKKDRGDAVTSDVMFHKPTMEHIDVMTNDDQGDGSTIIKATWTNHGTNEKIQNGTWFPISVADAIAQGKVIKFPIPDGNGGNGEEPPPNNDELVKRINSLESTIRELVASNHILAQRIDENSIATRNIASKIQMLIDKPIEIPVPDIQFPVYEGRIFGVTIKLIPKEE